MKYEILSIASLELFADNGDIVAEEELQRRYCSFKDEGDI